MTETRLARHAGPNAFEQFLLNAQPRLALTPEAVLNAKPEAIVFIGRGCQAYYFSDGLIPMTVQTVLEIGRYRKLPQDVQPTGVVVGTGQRNERVVSFPTRRFTLITLYYEEPQEYPADPTIFAFLDPLE